MGSSGRHTCALGAVKVTECGFLGPFWRENLEIHFVNMNPETKPRVQAKLLQMSLISPNGQCHLWSGTTKTKKNLEYGVLNLKLAPGRWRLYYVHRLAYMAHNDNFDISAAWDCSHLCHNTLCINAQHISLEKHSTNNNRQGCKAKGMCSGHGLGVADCRLDLILPP